MVQIYTRSSCAPCVAAKMFLTRKGVAYEEKNVDETPELMQEIMQKTGVMQVPMLLINDKVVSGANFSAIAAALNN